MGRRIDAAVLIRYALISLVGIQGFYLQAAESDYIDAVEADVKEFSTHEFQAPPGSTWLGSADAALSGIQSGTLDGFSRFLSIKSPGSHIFYRKLPKVYQEQLHSDYLATGDLERIKEDIFKYSREVKRQ